jgi:hypothetical protein
MAWQFQKHYTLEEARALLPKLREWLEELNAARARVTQLDQRLAQPLQAGHDVGGELVNQWIKSLARIQRRLRDFQAKEIQIKDLERGLIDFPAILAGREVFLCWERDEADIEFWHDLDTGYAGRVRLPEA